MAVIKTPGVYIEEISLPKTITATETSLPAFIGYTQRDSTGGIPTRISSLLEYENLFGTISPQKEIELRITNETTNPVQFEFVNNKSFRLHNFLYYSIRMYFLNGGGDCFIVSAGTTGEPNAAQLKIGLNKVSEIDEPTLVLIPDAVLLSENDYTDITNAMLSQCKTRRDRFAIIDVRVPKDSSDPVKVFRSAIMNDYANLQYGAAYYPYINSTWPFDFSNEEEITVTNSGESLHSIKGSNATLYGKLKLALENHFVQLPPSGAIAAIYVSVDNSRGVWKAPANVAAAGAHSPVTLLNNQQQDALNVDAVTGKSVNGIRHFAGKGTLVWGARTLAGNDVEFRYIPVRRFLIMLEQSISRSTSWVVFEPNGSETWIKLKAMIENFLINLWRNGAMPGAKPEQAFFVNVGLGKSMTALDIHEGRLIIQIGVAVVRPAEFIIINITHHMQKEIITTASEIAGIATTLLTTNSDWKTLVNTRLPEDQLKGIRDWMQKNSSTKISRAAGKLKTGYRALFMGPSGTGKTLTATLLGKELKTDVYRVDLSAVVSKYIGETEKNLDKIFNAAENKNWVLFFDEADALFGKRTEVKDAHDKYANQEIAYLLQRIESHSGLVIMATNKKANIDPAFIRHFQTVVEFPTPVK